MCFKIYMTVFSLKVVLLQLKIDIYVATVGHSVSSTCETQMVIQTEIH